jgi:hypothetical protein
VKHHLSCRKQQEWRACFVCCQVHGGGNALFHLAEKPLVMNGAFHGFTHKRFWVAFLFGGDSDELGFGVVAEMDFHGPNSRNSADAS